MKHAVEGFFIDPLGSTERLAQKPLCYTGCPFAHFVAIVQLIIGGHFNGINLHLVTRNAKSFHRKVLTELSSVNV